MAADERPFQCVIPNGGLRITVKIVTGEDGHRWGDFTIEPVGWADDASKARNLDAIVQKMLRINNTPGPDAACEYVLTDGGIVVAGAAKPHRGIHPMMAPIADMITGQPPE